MNSKFFRIFDIIVAITVILVAWPLMICIYTLGFFDTGSPVFVQRRVGKDMYPFMLYKFRTMNVNTKSVASHEVNVSNITTLGKFLRKTKFDELLQLWNVLKGDMSLVGPRPCLLTQRELIEERNKRGIFAVKPGITGLAQINGIDMSNPKLLSETDESMISNFSIKLYFLLLIKTLIGKGVGDAVRNS